MSRILILIHGNPQDYPPTLNAINELSPLFTDVDIVYKPYGNVDWIYPENVTLIKAGNTINVLEFEKSSFLNKVKSYSTFTKLALKSISKKNYDWVLAYDHLPMLSLLLTRILQPFKSKKLKIWYHNHDVAALADIRQYSISWLAKKAEIKLLKKDINLFSTPSAERLKYFVTNAKTTLLPNYPSLYFYTKYLKTKKLQKPIKLLYQGAISEGHGLRNVADNISSNKKMELHLAGPDRSNLVQGLINIESENNIYYHGMLSYSKLPKLTQSCHIGLAINEPKGIIYQTGGTASNKIYEYAACGLPILYFDNVHYNEHLAKYEWAFATDLSSQSINRCINEIMNNYTYLSIKAQENFQQIFNYEKAFEPIKRHLIETIE